MSSLCNLFYSYEFRTTISREIRREKIVSNERNGQDVLYIACWVVVRSNARTTCSKASTPFTNSDKTSNIDSR